MKRLFFTLAISLFVILGQGCNKRVTNPPISQPPDSSRIQLPRFGGDDSLEIAAWNIEWFPYGDPDNPRSDQNRTISDVAEIMKDLDIDLYAMEEIADTLAFRQLLTELPGYDGVYSSDVYSFGQYQKTAVVYRKSLIQISDKKALFTDDSYSFPRPPLHVYVTAQRNNKTVDFHFIVVHLKASGGSTNEARRRSACQKLENYIKTQIAAGSDPDFVVAGDWNDVLTDPPSQNVFEAFLNYPQDYTFLTWGLAQNPSENSTYIGWSSGSVIDHILITASMMPVYDSGTTATIKVDQYFSSYVLEVSDHRPVGAIFPAFK